jgi:hypothetical protein
MGIAGLAAFVGMSVLALLLHVAQQNAAVSLHVSNGANPLPSPFGLPRKSRAAASASDRLARRGWYNLASYVT